MLGVFGRKKTVDTETENPAEPRGVPVHDPEAKKNRPTPKRNAQQAKLKRSIVPEDRKEARRQYREEMARKRDEARRGMLAGDEKYLPARDSGPQRRYVRDFVDARFSMGELLIPVAVVILAIGFFTNRQVQLYATIAVYGLFAIIVLDSIFLRYQMRSRMAVKFGGKEKLERGLTFYAVMRTIQMRFLRTPKPQVKRGEYPA